MNQLADELAQTWGDVPLTGRYSPDVMYCKADAAVYHSMIRKHRPKNIVEIGSGYSTAVALDTIESAGMDTTITCIEPYPDRLRSLLRNPSEVLLHQAAVQDMPLNVYDQLESGDMLFIDSSHVVKPGSDVVWNFLRILPNLKPGVLVHVHDVFWPFEYRPEWLEERRDWTEIYLLHAFLVGNREWEPLLFSDLIWTERTDLVQRHIPSTLGERPGGFWMQRTDL